MRYIASWSGGKDSTASIILAHEHNEPITNIVFSEVMFDKKQNISGENPQHIAFVHEAKKVFESWGYEVSILHSERDYLDVFHRQIRFARKYPEHVGMKYGFVIGGMCSVKRDLKLKPIQDFYKQFKGEAITDYIGIAADEPKRLKSLYGRRISLLKKYGYTEKMAYRLCKEYGLLSPQYELSARGGCWMCPWAKTEEHRYIRENLPEAWKTFVALEDEMNVAQPCWNCITHETLHERELLFQKEDLSKI